MQQGVHITRGHLAAVVLAAILLPAASWLDGSGQLAWTMFSRTGQYRLVLGAVDEHGRSRPVAPTSLARYAGRAAAGYLAGADRFQHHDVARATFRRHLRDVALLACRVGGTRAIDATLEERVDLDAAVRRSKVRVRCER